MLEGQEAALGELSHYFIHHRIKTLIVFGTLNREQYDASASTKLIEKYEKESDTLKISVTTIEQVKQLIQAASHACVTHIILGGTGLVILDEDVLSMLQQLQGSRVESFLIPHVLSGLYQEGVLHIDLAPILEVLKQSNLIRFTVNSYPLLTQAHVDAALQSIPATKLIKFALTYQKDQIDETHLEPHQLIRRNIKQHHAMLLLRGYYVLKMRDKEVEAALSEKPFPGEEEELEYALPMVKHLPPQELALTIFSYLPLMGHYKKATVKDTLENLKKEIDKTGFAPKV